MPNINIKLSKEELEYLKKIKGQLTWKEFLFYLIAKEEAWRTLAIAWHKKQIKKLKQKGETINN